MTRPTNARQRGVEEEDHPMRHELDTTRSGGRPSLCPEHLPPPATVAPQRSRKADAPEAASESGDT